MATLTVAHHIYLTEDQRYDLHAGLAIKVVGVAIPVWFCKNFTSEPAHEIFCSYQITNDRSGTNVRYFKTKNEFLINMPHVAIIGDEYDKTLTKTIQNKFGTAENLLDYHDGGRGFCEFKYYHKLQISKKLHHIIHFVEIKRIEDLEETLN